MPDDRDDELDREANMDMGLDPDDPDYTELAAEGMTGDESDDEDLSDTDDDIAEDM
jgi:hypothetical protein